jgi:hypothetical protein
VTFQFANLIKIIDEQRILVQELVLNDELKDIYNIKRKTRNWAEILIKNNIGGLVSGTAFNLVCKLLSQM